MMKTIIAASFGAALVLAPLAAFAQTDAAPAATDAAPAADAAAPAKAHKGHMAKKHHPKSHKKMMMKKDDAPATDSTDAPADAPKQ